MYANNPGLDWLTGVPDDEKEKIEWLSLKLMTKKGFVLSEARTAARERWDLSVHSYHKKKFPETWGSAVWKGKFWNEDGSWKEQQQSLL